MYVRTIGNQELTFVVSGLLWQRSLVMMDLQTKSLWSHLLGKAMHGQLIDNQLKTLPALLTDWETWSKTHPKTTVMLMRRTAKTFTREMYQDLNKFVAGMSAGSNSKAWSFKQLAKHPLINDSFEEQPIVVSFDKKSATPFVYDRRIDQETLTFVLDGEKIVDQETGSVWDMEFGISTEGELSGTKLKPLVAISSFKKAWRNFHPKSEYWKPEK